MNIPKPKSYSETIEDLHSQVYVLKNENLNLKNEVARLNAIIDSQNSIHWVKVPAIREWAYGDIEPGGS